MEEKIQFDVYILFMNDITYLKKLSIQHRRFFSFQKRIYNTFKKLHHFSVDYLNNYKEHLKIPYLYIVERLPRCSERLKIKQN